MKIMLDAGHGAGTKHNRGFLQVDSLPYCNEGDCNFIYCKDYLKPALERYGHSVQLTRCNINDNPSLPQRGNMAKGYDLLISCHSNATNGTARGVEVWDSTNPEESIKPLCDEICINVSRTLNIPNRGTKYRKLPNGKNYYGILRYGQAKHNFIIEHVFHDNPQDVRAYRLNLKATAQAVADAIQKYIAEQPTTTAKNKANTNNQDGFINSLQKVLGSISTKILPSVTIAQAILESNWGKSELATNANNLFGIKASKDWSGEKYSKKTNEQDKDGNVFVVTADFRKYQSIKDSIIDHDNFFISTPWRIKNYERVLKATNYKEQAQALQACGYATDTKYADKLIKIIERLGLQMEDKKKEPSKWAEEDWKWATEKGITDGTNPQGVCTREQVVSMIRRSKNEEK